MNNNDKIRIPRELLDSMQENSSRQFLQRLQNFCSGWGNSVIQAGSLIPGATPPGLVSMFGAAIGGLAFDGAGAAEELHGFYEVDSSWIEGTAIKPYLRWIPTTAAAGNVKWQLSYCWDSNSGTSSSITTTAIVTAAAGAWTKQAAILPDISGAGKTLGAQLFFRIFRDSADASDTYAADAVLSCIGFHYEKNSIGSQQEYTK